MNTLQWIPYANNWHYEANPWKWLNLHFAFRLTSSLLWLIHLFPVGISLKFLTTTPCSIIRPSLHHLTLLNHNSSYWPGPLIPCMPRVYQAYSYLRAFLYMFVNTSNSFSPPSLCWNALSPDWPFLIWNSPSHPPNPHHFILSFPYLPTIIEMYLWVKRSPLHFHHCIPMGLTQCLACGEMQVLLE